MWLFATTFMGLGFVLLLQAFRLGTFAGLFVGLCFVVVGVIILIHSFLRSRSGNSISPNGPGMGGDEGDQTEPAFSQEYIL